MKFQFLQLIILILLVSVRGLAGNPVLCQAFYLKPTSIEFGLLFRKAKDVETVEALNEQSKDLIFKQETPDPLDHLINTLLYYRALERWLTPEQLESQFPKRHYRFAYFATKSETHRQHVKFNYFRRYLLVGHISAVHYWEPALQSD